jgi:2-polyprenyl-3-methyl-5-hydroxy-6-metoxy-1,4-benzoquinol methylase
MTVIGGCPLCGSERCTPEAAKNGAALLRCEDCSLVYATSRHVPEELYEQAYTEDAEYAEYLQLARKARQDGVHLTWAMRNFFRASTSPGSLLDIGSSTGSFLLAAQRRKWAVAGVELSASAARISSELTGASVTVGTIADHDQAAAYDAVTAWEVLEHVPEPRAFVDSCVRLLRPGGVFAISVPNWRSPWMKRSPHAHHWPPFHLTFWEREPLVTLLVEAGLVDVVVKEKPFAWNEEVGRIKWLYLPIALIRSTLFGDKGMHLFAMGRKP